MYTFFGWAELRYHSHDTNEELQNTAVDNFINYIDGMESVDISMVQRRNGLDSFMISRMHNHTASYIIDVFEWIAKNLPGSYGLLYVHDDEESYGAYKYSKYYDNPRVDNSNKFVVYKLAKGCLTREEDPFLSPCIPTIEDEYDPTRGD
jgi:hypothetical protein